MEDLGVPRLKSLKGLKFEEFEKFRVPCSVFRVFGEWSILIKAIVEEQPDIVEDMSALCFEFDESR